MLVARTDSGVPSSRMTHQDTIRPPDRRSTNRSLPVQPGAGRCRPAPPAATTCQNPRDIRGMTTIAQPCRHPFRARDETAGPNFWDLQLLWRVLGLNQRRLSRRFYSEQGPRVIFPVFAGL